MAGEKLVRTVHYWTKEPVTAGELERIREVGGRYNVGHEWTRERIKLWRESPGGELRGFTKVGDCGRDGEVVVRAVLEMSRVTPRLTWVLFDEGLLTGCREIIIRRGERSGE